MYSISEVKNKYPTLSKKGFYDQKNFRSHFYDNVSRARVLVVKDWIEQNLTQKTRINKKLTSGDLRALAERELKIYIANGDYILAMLMCGYSFQTIDGSKEINFNAYLKNKTLVNAS